MTLPFTKMHGLGNDFVVLDHLDHPGEVTPILAALLADRRLGVGCDQVVQLLPPRHGGNAEMRIFNADGSRAEMCGNAARCVALFLKRRRGLEQPELLLETLAGMIRLYPGEEEQVTVDMGEPELLSQYERTLDDLLPGLQSRGVETGAWITEISMGNPHCVILQPRVEGIDLAAIGPRIERHPRYPRRTNVEFVQVLGQDRVRMRVWERGAGITPACGTGACAAAVATMAAGLTERRTQVQLDGGTLDIHWTDANRILMTGPAREVFQGQLLLDPHGA